MLDTREGIRKGGDTRRSRRAGQPRGEPPDPGHPIPGRRPQDAAEDRSCPTRSSPTSSAGWRWGRPTRATATVTAAAKGIDIEKGRRVLGVPAAAEADPAEVKDAPGRGGHRPLPPRRAGGQGLKPVADADKHTLLRRVYFDLIGLPPTPEEVDAFVKDDSPAAFETVVDRLLASPQFGERWGRHWLDVARFAESSGKQVNFNYPHAWRYRDYVIAAFNTDKPFDRFVREQIAGDLLPAADPAQRAEQTIATGFLAIGPKSHVERSPLQFQLDLADEQIDATSQAFLGLTVACARCHDHKFDPIPTRDYYALAGHLPAAPRPATARSASSRTSNPAPLLALAGFGSARWPRAADRPAARSSCEGQIAELRKATSPAQKEGKAFLVRPAIRLGDPDGDVAEPARLCTRRTARRSAWPWASATGYGPHDSPLYQRGELDKPGEIVPRGVVQVVSRAACPRSVRGAAGSSWPTGWPRRTTR